MRLGRFEQARRSMGVAPIVALFNHAKAAAVTAEWRATGKPGPEPVTIITGVPRAAGWGERKWK
ncbi:MAG TPA: hypothetical protein VGO18_35330 [Steroidobacteraceae bacterium]|nr:hypothetical protein [Steroidobacteraceae bacterium]